MKAENRSSLADLARRSGLELAECERFVSAIVDELALGREVRLQGLGTFRTTESKPRTIERDFLKKKGTVPARKVIRFAQASTARAKING